MSKAQIIFIFKGIKTIVPCSTNEKIRNILERLTSKMEIEINKVFCLYNGKIINENINFEELANKEDKLMKTLNIVLCKINNNTNDNMKKSKEIISLNAKRIF